MSITAIVILCIYFLIGAVALNAIGKNKTNAEKKESWLKYYVYIIIVSVVLPILYLGHTAIFILHLFIVLFGLYEIISISYKVRTKYLIAALVVYLPIATLFCLYALLADTSQKFYWLIFFLVLVFDGFAQISGQLFGGKKLVPSVSPKKTISGVLGGTLMCSLTALLLCYEGGLDFLWYGILIGLLVSAFALGGDLLASVLKRKCNVKDYSHIIPGHGGVLDRFDSYIMVAASIYLGYFLVITFIMH